MRAFSGAAANLFRMGYLGSLEFCYAPNHLLRSRQRRPICGASATFGREVGTFPSHQADLVDWPEGRRPTSGKATRTALTKLKVANLRSELTKRNLEVLGKKKHDLVEALFFAIQDEWVDLTSVQDRKSTTGDSGAASGRECQEDEPSTTGDSEDLDDVAYLQRDHKSIEWVRALDGSDHEIPFGGVKKVPADLDDAAKWEYLRVNKAGIQMIFLGTSSGCAGPHQALPSMVFRTQADNWLFDVGDDTQRQMMKHPIIRPGKITRLFVTSLSPDVIQGLPGMICTISASREHGHKSSDTPVHVYGPSGISEFIETMFRVSQTYIDIPLIIHEFVNVPIPNGFQLDPLRGAPWGLWRSLIPPDVLNPMGWYDAELNSVKPVRRRSKKPTGKRFRANLVNSRSFFRSFDLPGAGDPSRNGPLLSEARWTLKINEQFKVVVVPLKSEIPTVAYLVQEADRSGSLDVKRAQQLGIEDKKMYGKLKAGYPAENIHGKTIPPELVVSPDWKGRNILILGKTRDPEATLNRSLVNKLNALVLPVTQKPSSTERDMLVHKEVLELSRELQPEVVLFNQIETSDEEHGKQDDDLSGSALKMAGDLYTHILEAHPPPPVPPLSDQMLRDLGLDVEASVNLE